MGVNKDVKQKHSKEDFEKYSADEIAESAVNFIKKAASHALAEAYKRSQEGPGAAFDRHMLEVGQRKKNEERLKKLIESLSSYFGPSKGQRVDCYETRVARELEWAKRYLEV